MSEKTATTEEAKPPPSQEELEQRRLFCKKALATVLGGFAILTPAAAGVTMVLDPLRRKAVASKMSRVASLDAIPKDGIPRKFTVLASKVDAWTKTPLIPVGAVYIRRTGDATLEVLNVVCPHAGCFVDYMPDQKSFFCPCHNSNFKINGQVDGASNPSPRDLDSLKWEIRNGKEIWVKFENYISGQKEKVPVS